MVSIRDLTNNTSYTLSYPSELLNSESQYPFMVYDIVKYQAPISIGKILDDKKDQSAGLIISTAVAAVAQGLKNFIPTDGVTDPANVEFVHSIALPITQHVSNALGIGWRMEEMPGTQALLGALNQTTINSANNTPDGWDDYKGIFNGIKDQVTKGQYWQSIAASQASDLLKKTVGMIANPKKQALFDGVAPREFTFEHIFTPKNLKEAQTVEQIISMFTVHSLPSIDTASGNLLFDFPEEFIISFHGVQGFPKLSPCVCTGVVTNYTPSSLQLLEDGHAVQIVLALQFVETTIRTQQYPGIKIPTGGK